VLLGLKPRLVTDAAKLRDRACWKAVLPPCQQSVGTPQGRPAGAKYLGDFAKDVKTSGFVAAAIATARGPGGFRCALGEEMEFQARVKCLQGKGRNSHFLLAIQP